MAAQRRIDLVLDSVKRLLRIGATANLVNLLQKQHPADLAQVFTELADKEREAAFSLLAERNGRLAMEAVSELGPEVGAALLATRSAEEVARLAQEIPSDDAAALIDHLPEELSAAVLDLMRHRMVVPIGLQAHAAGVDQPDACAQAHLAWHMGVAAGNQRRILARQAFVDLGRGGCTHGGAIQRFEQVFMVAARRAVAQQDVLGEAQGVGEAAHPCEFRF